MIHVYCRIIFGKPPSAMSLFLVHIFIVSICPAARRASQQSKSSLNHMSTRGYYIICACWEKRARGREMRRVYMYYMYVRGMLDGWIYKSDDGANTRKRRERVVKFNTRYKPPCYRVIYLTLAVFYTYRKIFLIESEWEREREICICACSFSFHHCLNISSCCLCTLKI